MAYLSLRLDLRTTIISKFFHSNHSQQLPMFMLWTLILVIGLSVASVKLTSKYLRQTMKFNRIYYKEI